MEMTGKQALERFARFQEALAKDEELARSVSRKAKARRLCQELESTRYSLLLACVDVALAVAEVNGLDPSEVEKALDDVDRAERVLARFMDDVLDVYPSPK